MKPKVSVAILAHPGHSHLRRCIESVLAQTFKSIEVIVVYTGQRDDDEVKGFVSGYGDTLQVIIAEHKSVADALNTALASAKGDYFCWLSQDDVYVPEAIEALVAKARKANTVVVADWEMRNRNNRRIRLFEIDDQLQKHPRGFLTFATDAQINTSAMLFHVALLGKKPFSRNYASARDIELLERLIVAGAAFKLVDRPLLQYASHSEEAYTDNADIISDYDVIHSNLISQLSYDEMTSYFKGNVGVLARYGELLEAGRPRSAAILIEKVITGLIASKKTKLAGEVLLSQLSCLTEDNMTTDADALLDKAIKKGAKKRLMFSSGHWLTGGMERVMSTLFRELHEQYDLYLLTPYDPRESHIPVPDYVTHVLVSDEQFQKHFDVAILAYALLLKIDVVIGNMNLFEKQLNAYSLFPGTGIKSVASNHEYYFYPYKSPAHYHVAQKRLDAFRSCSAIVWPTNFNAALCGMYTDRNYVIGNPNNFEISRDKEAHARSKNIICVGRFNDYVKRIDRILECFALVLKEVPDAKLLLVGKYDMDAPIAPGGKVSVGDLLRSLDIPAGSIEFIGEVSNMPDFYSQARTLLLTSNSEGFGMMLNEAACFGVPAVANYIPGIEDLVVDGENGYITEQDDLKTMAARTVRILTDDTLSMKLSAAARKRVVNYDSKHVGAKWRMLLDAVIEDQDQAALQSSIGYQQPDPTLFAQVLARELHAIFLMTSGSQQPNYGSGALLLLSKVRHLPNRLRENIAYEGLPKTIHKVASRSYRIAKNRLKLP